MSNVIFSIETNINQNGKKLKSLQPDNEGWYHGVPLAVVDDNIITWNNTLHDAQSFIQCLQNPNLGFRKRLEKGDLFGEYNHPFLPSLDPRDPKVLARLLWLEPSKKAVHYKKISVVKTEDGLQLVTSVLKPMGPYGQYAKEQLEDPYIDYSSSLRAISEERTKNINGKKVSYRRMIALITFDACVPGGGYPQASKRYANISLENFLEMISHDGLLEIADTGLTVSYESLLTQSELNDILKSSKIQLTGKITAYKFDKELLFMEDNQHKRSIFYITKELI